MLVHYQSNIRHHAHSAPAIDDLTPTAHAAPAIVRTDFNSAAVHATSFCRSSCFLEVDDENAKNVTTHDDELSTILNRPPSAASDGIPIPPIVESIVSDAGLYKTTRSVPAQQTNSVLD